MKLNNLFLFLIASFVFSGLAFCSDIATYDQTISTTNQTRKTQKTIDPEIIKILKIYTDESGETHFGTITIDLKDKGTIGKISDLVSGTGVMFRTTPGDYNFDWHNTPRKQFVVNLDAPVKIQTSDKETRIIEKGQVFLLEDTKGKGHYSESINNQSRTSLFIPVN